MAENVGKIEIVIKGGKPWGFRLQSISESRSAIVIGYIEPGGKAEIHGGLKVGDHVIKINDVLCLSLADALQLIDSAFRTLTILVWRPSYCSQEDKRMQNKISAPQSENFNSLPLTFCDSKLNGAAIQNFRSYAVIPNYNDKCTPTSSSSNTQEFLCPLPHKFTNLAQHPAQTVSCSKDLSKTNYKESFYKSKNNFNSKNDCNDRSFVPFQSSQSNQNANIHYMCEQFPLSKLFLNKKSDIEFESLTSHSKKLFTSQSKAGQVQDFDLMLEHNTKNFSEIPSQVMNSSTHNVSESVCCMYPECHSRYKNCNMHSPPERDQAVPQTNILDHLSDSVLKHFKYKKEEKYGLDCNTSGKLIERQSSKNLNCPPYENVKLIIEHQPSANLKSVSYNNALEMREDGFKNRGLKIFKPVELSPKTRLTCPDYYACRRQRENESSYAEASSLNSEQSVGGEIASDYHLSVFNKDLKYNRYKNKISHQTFSNEVIPEVSMKHTVFISHSKQNNLSQHEKIVEQNNSTYEAYNQRENSKILNQTAYQGSYFNEEEHSVFLHTNEFKTQCANETSIVNLPNICLSYAESSKSDGDEDEELCLIEENARNNNCFIASSLESKTPDLALPPPPLNEDSEIIPSNDPLPPPP